ncbi:uncharacterized protein KQ657_004181 [Scheffersomyces spartinae]|uniref:Transcription factor domain-containing protein n=1 Tax=Scheffersomyces spartinae TaxID=45513 RepID=A0A9P7VBY1_9ASCO|nr:uncharacterized protein KQ657_004181 [Scheffersomyces spartinae]KAG7195067.1 hypothetical protein KQ657_004181 [Scheffersomyces spartinae]
MGGLVEGSDINEVDVPDGDKDNILAEFSKLQRENEKLKERIRRLQKDTRVGGDPSIDNSPNSYHLSLDSGAGTSALDSLATASQPRVSRSSTGLQSIYLSPQLSNEFNFISGGKKTVRKPIVINGETSELGSKYYGPQSVDYMVDVANKSSSNGPVPNTLKLSRPEFRRDNTMEQDLLARAAQKKKLPWIVYLVPNEANSNVNYHAIVSLVKFFFHPRFRYYNFYSRVPMLMFLENYPKQAPEDWENDDDLLLLCTILIISLQMLTPTDCVTYKIVAPIDIDKCEAAKKYVVSNKLFHTFQCIRHSLVCETFTSIQSYILCSEWHFKEKRYEECWSMMFHTCAIAFAIGLHMKVDDNIAELNRVETWFALKELTSIICSILGRPSPLSLSLNVAVENESTEIIKHQKVNCALRVGVSECLQMANALMIDNMNRDIDIDSLFDLDKRIDAEIELFRNSYLTKTEIKPVDQAPNQVYLPTYVSRESAYITIFMLSITKAKTRVPFLEKFEHKVIVSLMMLSITDYLATLELLVVEYFKNLESTYDPVRCFQLIYPFLSVFILQGIVCILALMNVKSQYFINGDPLLSNDFLTTIERRILAVKWSLIWPQNLASGFDKILDFIQILRANMISANPTPIMNIQYQETLVQTSPTPERPGLFPSFTNWNVKDPFNISRPDETLYLNDSQDFFSIDIDKFDLNPMIEQQQSQGGHIQPVNVEGLSQMQNLEVPPSTYGRVGGPPTVDLEASVSSVSEQIDTDIFSPPLR